MNSNLIEDLLKSDDITHYIYELCKLFNCIDDTVCNCNYNFISNGDDDIKVVETELELFASIDNISKFLSRIDDIDYKLIIATHPIFIYIKNIIFKLENIFIDLLILDKKTKSLLINSVNSNNLEIAISYSNFLLELTQLNEIIDFSKYANLNYNVLFQLQKLNELTIYATHIFNSIKFSFNSYLVYYSISTDNNINIPNSIVFTKKHLITNVIELMNIVNSIIEKYWIDYINATKFSIFLQSLIQDMQRMIMYALKNNNTKAADKYSINSFVFTLLINSYDDYISKKLIIVVEYSRIQLFLSSIIDHMYKK